MDMREEAVREEVSDRLGRELSDTTWRDMYDRAKEKLRHIVTHFGDADGARDTVGYIAQLVIEAMQAEALRLWTAANYPQRDEGPAQRPTPQGHTNIILRNDPKSQGIFV